MQIDQQYLLPSQVEGLRALGVEFEDTILSWRYYFTKGYVLELSSKESLFSNEAKVNGKSACLPAPDLQKVLEKLPKSIKGENLSSDYALHIEWDEDGACCISYDLEDESSPFVLTFGEIGIYPLFAAYKMLRYVAENYPECLTETK